MQNPGHQGATPTAGRAAQPQVPALPVRLFLCIGAVPELTSINKHLNIPKYLKCMLKSTDRARVPYAPTMQLHIAATAAPLTLYKLLSASASVFQEPKTWLPVSFRNRQYQGHAAMQTGVGGSGAVLHDDDNDSTVTQLEANVRRPENVREFPSHGRSPCGEKQDALIFSTTMSNSIGLSVWSIKTWHFAMFVFLSCARHLKGG